MSLRQNKYFCNVKNIKTKIRIMNKIYYLICVFSVAILASCSSTDTLTEQENPVPNVLNLRMTKDVTCEDHNYVRETIPTTSESRKRTDETTEYEYVEPVKSIELTYVDGDSLKYVHKALQLECGSAVWLSVNYDSNAKRIMIVENGINDNMADCMCHYSPEGNIGKLETGKYTIAIYRDIQTNSYDNYSPKPIEELKAYFEKEINFKKGMHVVITEEELNK